MVGGECLSSPGGAPERAVCGGVVAVDAEGQEVEVVGVRFKPGSVDVGAVGDDVGQRSLGLGDGEQFGQPTVQGGFATDECDFRVPAGQQSSELEQLLVG